jgi:soluble lytic murein transglycosylase-like protein
MAATVSPAWCPEWPVLERLRDAMLQPYLKMSPHEMWALLRPEFRSLPSGFTTIARAVDEESRRHGIPAELLLAVIWAESAFRGDAVSERGAVGLMQLMPGTAADLASELEMAWTGEEVLYDARANITLGAFYLSKLLATFDDLDRALAAYNRGPAAPVPPGGWDPRGETASFMLRVKSLMAQRASLAPPRSFGDPKPFTISSRIGL